MEKAKSIESGLSAKMKPALVVRKPKPVARLKNCGKPDAGGC
jgi:hypothetical protein